VKGYTGSPIILGAVMESGEAGGDRAVARYSRTLAAVDEGAIAASPVGTAAAIDPSVLTAWLGDDRAGIEALLQKFRDTAIESEQAIDAAWRATDLAGLAAAAHRLRGAAQAIGATPATAAATGSVRWRLNCAAPSARSRADTATGPHIARARRSATWRPQQRGDWHERGSRAYIARLWHISDRELGDPTVGNVVVSGLEKDRGGAV
jgi:hypothetical protein